MAIRNFNVLHGLSLGDTDITVVDINANVIANRVVSNTIISTNNSNITLSPHGTGVIDVSGKLISNLEYPASSTDAATKSYVDDRTSVGSVAAAGADTELQFNNNGTIGADANLTYDYANSVLTVTGSTVISSTLNVASDANIQGNLTVGGTLTYIDSTKVSIVDPVLELGGGPDGSLLSSNDTLDRGTLLHYYTTKPMDAFMGWKTDDSQFVFGSNVTDSASSVTVNEYANVKAANFLGNLIGGQANLSNVNFTNNVTGGNLVSANYFTGTLTTNSQTNITSLGTLTNVTVSGNTVSANANIGNLVVTQTSNLGNVGNVKITGGTTGQYLQTDGAGNLIWQNAASTNKIFNGTSNITVNNDGTVTLSSNNVSNVIVVDGNAVSVNGSLSVSNLTTTNAVSITSTTDSTAYNNGALTIAGGLGVAGNIRTNTDLVVASNTFVNNITVQGKATLQDSANFESIVTLTGVTDSTSPSTGVLILTTGGLGVAGNINSSQNISGATLTGTLTTNAQPNITSVGTLTSLNVSGSITGANANLGNLVTSNYFTGTLTTASQPNITTVGTLSNLAVAGNTTTNNLSVTSNIVLGSPSNITIAGGTVGQYLQTDGTGNISWSTVSTSTLVNGSSNLIINPSGSINISSNGTPNVIQINENQVHITPSTDSINYTTGALVVDGGVGISGNVFINGLLNISGDFQVGNLNTSGPVEHTGEVTFTQVTYFTNAIASTSTTTGAVKIAGGLGVQGNIYGGNIISSANTILRNGRNVPTFISSLTMPSSPLLGDAWYDQNSDRIYQYIFDGESYNWLDMSGGYISASVQADPGTVAVRDNNGNVYANTLVANQLNVANIVITGTTSISSTVSGGTGAPVSNTTETIIDTFPKTLYRSAKYIISARNDDGFEVAEMLLIHDNMISFIQTYGDVSTGAVQDIVTFSSNIVGGNVCLYATGSNSNTFVNLISTYVTD